MSKKVYFLSDFHLGLDAQKSSEEREHLIVDWLGQIADQAEAIYLVGDVFDYWFEYSKVIPKGFNLLFGKLKELRSRQIPIHFFIGNHDMWMFRYFEEEFGIPIYREPIEIEHFGKKIFIGHGDGLGPGDYGYKFIKAIFGNKICQWLFARIHPNLGIALMKYVSKKDRNINGEEQFYGPQKERLIVFCEDKIKEKKYDYFVFGHRHLPIDYTLTDGQTRYINLGDWINYFSYAVLDQDGMHLKFAFDENQTIHGL